VVGLALAVGTTAPARAAFPGHNGRIFFDTLWGVFNGAPSSQIYSVRADGSHLHRLTHEPAGFVAYHPAVAPAALRVTYVLSGPEMNDQIWVMRFDGTHQRLVVDEPAWADSGPSFTANGRRILYSRCGFYIANFFTCKIVSVRLDGSGRHTIVPGRWHPSDPVASPNRSKIAYVSDSGGYDSRIWIVDTDGRHRHAVGPKNILMERLSWSPDGTHISFTDERHDRVYVVRANGTGLTRIATDHIWGVWAPDGSRMVSKVTGPHNGFGPLVTTKPDGTDPVRVVDRSLRPGFSDWGIAR
jgi:Tol biopolymer transport system component